ncbi:hypothetical protein BLNAU_12014 [Blattamonas nauphoetae]|uniref:Uncharacterized protein n=1 Tax=Blattamonas nauphoetae TaxID=2049346 RepID=A0ABQ9XPA2_9EUKA|nr:hypothetical protein BLNAU_12014 [Blattamonas nauphoetae]
MDSATVPVLNQLSIPDEDGKYVTGIRIPYTVVIADGEIKTWFYYSLKSGRILKKPQSCLTPQKILKAFSKLPAGGGVIASFDGVSVVYNESTRRNEKIQSKQFLTLPSLQNFFRSIEYTRGVLQEFVIPNERNNFSLAVHWTPYLNFIENISSKFYLDDETEPSQKCATYEGPEYLTTKTYFPNGPFHDRLTGYCQQINDHLSRLSKGKKEIKHCLAQFRIDSERKIVFIWMTSMSLQPIGANLSSVNQPVRERNSARSSNILFSQEPPKILPGQAVISPIKTIQQEKMRENHRKVNTSRYGGGYGQRPASVNRKRRRRSRSALAGKRNEEGDSNDEVSTFDESGDALGFVRSRSLDQTDEDAQKKEERKQRRIARRQQRRREKRRKQKEWVQRQRYLSRLSQPKSSIQLNRTAPAQTRSKSSDSMGKSVNMSVRVNVDPYASINSRPRSQKTTGRKTNVCE